jgi:hypothetical protein
MTLSSTILSSWATVTALENVHVLSFLSSVFQSQLIKTRIT